MADEHRSYSRAIVAAGWMAAGAALLGAAAPGSAQAAGFTEQECKVVAAVTGEVVRAVGKDELSVDFRKTLVTFIVPDSKHATCTGPAMVKLRSLSDQDAISKIHDRLLEKDINILARGLVLSGCDNGNQYPFDAKTFGASPGQHVCSPLAVAGLSYDTVKWLASDGFSSDHIMHAAQDAATLGFSPRDRGTVRDFAVLDRVDPSGRADRNAAYAKYAEWLKQNKDQINALQEAVENATTEKARKLAIAARDRLIKNGQRQTGLSR